MGVNIMWPAANIRKHQPIVWGARVRATILTLRQNFRQQFGSVWLSEAFSCVGATAPISNALHIHPEMFQTPLCSHREMVNAWFAERVHSIQPSSADPLEPCSLSSAATAPSPLPGTPARKISASEFDRPLRPIVVKDAEGSLTFLSDVERETLPVRAVATGEGGDVQAGRCGAAGADSGGGQDRCARLLELVKEVSSHLDVTALCHKIFLHTNELIAADRYSLFLVGGVRPAMPSAPALGPSERRVDAVAGGRGQLQPEVPAQPPV